MQTPGSEVRQAAAMFLTLGCSSCESELHCLGRLPPDHRRSQFTQELPLLELPKALPQSLTLFCST